MDDFKSLLGAPREWAWDLAVATGIGLFLGLIGPFGSFNGGPLELRVPYWIANIWIGFLIVSLTVRLALLLAKRFEVPFWFALPVGVALGCLPLAMAVSLFSYWFWPSARGQSFLSLYGETLVLSEPCGFAFFLLNARTGARRFLSPAAPAAPALAHPAEPSFLTRLPQRFNQELLCLQMEDHYVRAHLPRGSDLILTSMKQAIEELDGVEGLQVHRSWWVRRSAVGGVLPRGRNVALQLTNGLEVPVSRASVAKLKAAGWLAEDGAGRPIFNARRA